MDGKVAWTAGVVKCVETTCKQGVEPRAYVGDNIWRRQPPPKWVAVAIVVVATTRGALFLAKKTTLAQMGIEV